MLCVGSCVSFIVGMSFHAFGAERGAGFMGQAEYQNWLWTPFGVHPAERERCPGTAAEGMCLDGAVSHWYQPLLQETQMKKPSWEFHILSYSNISLMCAQMFIEILLNCSLVKKKMYFPVFPIFLVLTECQCSGRCLSPCLSWGIKPLMLENSPFGHFGFVSQMNYGFTFPYKSPLQDLWKYL